jgi:hypothetical protein
MLACLHGVNGDLGVETTGYTDAYGVNVVAGQQFMVVNVGIGVIFLGKVVGAAWHNVGNGDELRVGNLLEGLSMARGDASTANDAKT